MAGLDDILNSSAEAQETAEPVAEPEAQAPDPVAEGAPAAPQASEKHVPLAALEAERQGRQDWKEKAIRAEERAAALERQIQNAQQPQAAQQHQVDPLVNTRMDFSELLLRQSMPDATDIDDKIEKFKALATADPSLAVAMGRSQHPWKFAYDKAKQAEMLQEIGTDPVAYRARLEAEIRASMTPTPVPTVPAVQIPASLNGARSVAPRSAPGFTGPTPLSQILPN